MHDNIYDPIPPTHPRVCYVSAYYDIGREQWQNVFTRTFDEYLRRFEPFMLVPHDQFILYMDSRYVEQVNTLLSQHASTAHNITVVPIDEAFLLAYTYSWALLEKERDVMRSEHFAGLVRARTARHGMLHPEAHIPEYTIVTHMKPDFVCHAREAGYTDCDYMCWVDFGYHGRASCAPSAAIDFAKFDPLRVSFPLVHSLDSRDFDIEYTFVHAPEKIAGYFFFGHYTLLKAYQRLYHTSIDDLQSKHIADDDQHLTLRCIYKNPALFRLYHFARWHVALRVFEKDDLFSRLHATPHTLPRCDALTYRHTYIDNIHPIATVLAQYIDDPLHILLVGDAAYTAHVWSNFFTSASFSATRASPNTAVNLINVDDSDWDDMCVAFRCDLATTYYDVVIICTTRPVAELADMLYPRLLDGGYCVAQTRACDDAPPLAYGKCLVLDTQYARTFFARKL